MANQGNMMGVLQQLERGEIDADQALQMMENIEREKPVGSGTHAREWREWWLVPFSLGMAGAAAGYGVSQLGGAWWICAGPLMVIGTTVMVAGILSSQSPWVHIRVSTGQVSWPRRIAISLPLPLRLTARVLRWMSPRVEGFDQTIIDELITSLEENVAIEAPLRIEVEEGKSGERVEVFLG
jgi:hypothetical protein